VHAVARARETIPELRAVIYGDGPERPNVLAAIAERGLEGIVDAPGFVEPEIVESALSRALCLVLPSQREGYGLVVLEALSRATPAIVVRGEDNASTEFVEEGTNGFVVASSEPEELVRAISLAYEAGSQLRQSTLAAFMRSAKALALDTSLLELSAAYSGASSVAR
jgi:glycosyltransferase involved in cell wall biosynthesis